MDEVTNKNIYDEKTNESLEEITELTLGDDSWSELVDSSSLDSKCNWNQDVPLSDDLRLLDEEQKQQIAEARAWIEEEEAVDEILRKDIAELQLAKQKNQEDVLDEIADVSKQKHDSSSISPDLPPEAEEKINELENKVKNLQDQLDEKTLKVAQVSDLYSELLNKLNESRERSLATDREFKASFTRIKEDYAEVEALLKSEIDRYKAAAKQLEFKLTEKEIEVTELRQEREEIIKSQSEFEAKLNESTASLESLNKYILKLKVQLKNIKTERDALKKEMINVEDIELIKQRLSQIEEERNALLKEKAAVEDLTTLRDRITLLEEEKGNLQLQVIDLDEMKETALATKKQYSELETSFAELKNSTSLLESENGRIVSNYEKAESKIKDQQSIIDRFLKSAQESEEQKIIAVMRSVELEEQLSFRDKEISQLKEGFSKLEIPCSAEQQVKLENFASMPQSKSENDDLFEKIKLLETEKMNNDQSIAELKTELIEVENSLKNAQNENNSLKNALEELNSDKKLLVKELAGAKSREEVMKKDMSLSSSGNVSTSSTLSESDPFYIKFKKVVANYKLKAKLCQELEGKLENIKIELATKDNLISVINSEKQKLEEEVNVLRNGNTEEKSKKVKELIMVVEQICNIDEGGLGDDADTGLLNEIVEKWKNANEANICMVQQQMTQMNTVLLNVAKLEGELEELKISLKEKDDAITELEHERAKLSDVVKFNEKELEMLRTMYENVSEKNEHFYSDLMSIEKEMANGKTELLTRLEVVTQNYDTCLTNLQERENYIETLEQDIITMKTRIYNLELGMEEKHRVLKETSDQMMAKFQAAEIMSQTFEKYKNEVENKIEALENQKRKAEENELILKELIKTLEGDREFAAKENEECIKKLEQLLQEKSESASQILNMSTELDNLRDIRNSYNTTLDKIEELNSELTQTTVSFEVKNQRLEMLEQERMELVNKLTDLEDAFSDLESKLEECTEKNNNLEGENNLKTQNLEKVELEKLEIINKVNIIENTCTELSRKLDECTDKNNNLINELDYKGQKLDILEREKIEFADKINVLEGICRDLGTKLQECTEREISLESEAQTKGKQLSEANQKLFELQTQLVESEALCASFQDELSKMEKDLKMMKHLQEEKKRLEKMLRNRSEEDNDNTARTQNPIPELESSKLDVASSQAVGVFTWTDQAALDNPFGEIKDEEDGWGWMAQEAALEHDHKHSEALKIQELTNKLSKASEERDHFLNELTSTKTKCQKLMKKIKEIKTINENLERAKTDIKVGFSDLDFAVQEELRAENDKQQAVMTEMNREINLLKTEKDSMSKRLDTLISANDQLIDLKERQDLEVQMWQKKSNQLMNEVKFLKSSLETNGTSSEYEIPDKITALVNENDELKLILEAKKRELEVKTKEIDSELPEKFAALACENEELTALLNVQKRDQEMKVNEYMEKINSVIAEKENLVHNIGIKDQQIQELLVNKGDPELPVRYNTLITEYENIKVLLNSKEQELLAAIQQRDNMLTKRNSEDFCQQTEPMETPLSVQENVQPLRVFSFDDTREDTFSKDLQLSRELEEMRTRVQTLTDERVNLEGYISRLEDELQRIRGAEEEALLKADRDRDDLTGHLEDAKREAALWRQKADELSTEADAKEEMYFKVLKEKEQKFQQNLEAKGEENAYLVSSLTNKEETIKLTTNEIQLLRSEAERMKDAFSVEKNTLEEEIKRLTTELTLSCDPASGEEYTNMLTQLLTDLQKKLDDTVRENMEQDTIIDSLRQQIILLKDEKGETAFSSSTLDYNKKIENLEQEKLLIDTLLKERQAEVESLRQELTTLMKRKAETQEHDNFGLAIKEKDGEIGRLTKTVVEMQERLLRMEEGKLIANVHDLQSRLDKALYTVHNRDVKCEELTQEIMQLLEERDTLQFRLAESLRMINTLNRDESASASSTPTHHQNISTQLPSSPVNEKLNKIRHEYRRDPTVQIESENRHMQHMQLYSHQEETSPSQEVNTSADFGFFNWFFGGSGQSPSSTEPQSIPSDES